MIQQTAVRQLCTFYLGAELFGIDVLQVQEVLRHPAITPVPMAARFVSGLMNLRGSIVTCIDLRLRFGMPTLPPQFEPVQVVVKTKGGLVSFQVDRIGEVVEITDAELELPPATLDEEGKKMINAVYKLKDTLLLVTHPENILQFEDSSL